MPTDYNQEGGGLGTGDCAADVEGQHQLAGLSNRQLRQACSIGRGMYHLSSDM